MNVPPGGRSVGEVITEKCVTSLFNYQWDVLILCGRIFERASFRKTSIRLAESLCEINLRHTRAPIRPADNTFSFCIVTKPPDFLVIMGCALRIVIHPGRQAPVSTAIRRVRERYVVLLIVLGIHPGAIQPTVRLPVQRRIHIVAVPGFGDAHIRTPCSSVIFGTAEVYVRGNITVCPSIPVIHPGYVQITLCVYGCGCGDLPRCSSIVIHFRGRTP